MDLISRQAAIDGIREIASCCDVGHEPEDYVYMLQNLPSAQPEIIRCKDCKYHDEGYRRISVKWLPCMDICPGSNWYCGSAERRTDE